LDLVQQVQSMSESVTAQYVSEAFMSLEKLKAESKVDESESELVTSLVRALSISY
jgi:hypothetical protein